MRHPKVLLLRVGTAMFQTPACKGILDEATGSMFISECTLLIRKTT